MSWMHSKKLKSTILFVLFLMPLHEVNATCIAGADKLANNAIDESILIWRKLGYAEDLASQVALVVNCLKKQNIVYDEVEAMHWLHDYSEQGYTEALVMYATYQYVMIKEDEKYDKNNISWIERSAKTGDKDGLYLLAQSYINGLIDNINNININELLIEAGNLGSIPAQRSLAYYYRNGISGFDQDIKQSDCWYNLSIITAKKTGWTEFAQ